LTERRTAIRGRERAFFAVALGAALLRGFAAPLGLGGGLALAAKGATVPPLALVAWGRRRELPGGALLAVALLAHSAGDLLLERAFLVGVAAFFAGHLGYIALFWRERRSIDDLGGRTKLALGVLALAGAAFLALLAPRLAGAQRAAIPLYAAALLSMAGSALHCRRGRPWVPLGAAFYVASDVLLSLELFGAGVGALRLLVWPLYASAQLAITFGWCFGPLETGENEAAA
jgi:uncharacterized membrane protein YhhN